MTQPHWISAPSGALARICATAVVVGVLWLTPADVFRGAPTICLFKRFAGVECYGCGMTRAAYALARGDIHAAARHNRLVFPLGFAVGILATWDVHLLVRRARKQEIKRSRGVKGDQEIRRP